MCLRSCMDYSGYHSHASAKGFFSLCQNLGFRGRQTNVSTVFSRSLTEKVLSSLNEGQRLTRIIPTLSLGGRRHRGRWVSAEVTVEGFIEGLRMSSLKEIREIFVSYQMKKFVRSLVRWNLAVPSVARKWMFVAPLRLFAIYILPN